MSPNPFISGDYCARRHWIGGASWRCLGILLACVAASNATAQEAALGPEIVDLLDAPPVARPVPSPDDRYLLLVQSKRLLPMARLSEPAIELAGRFVNPSTGTPHAPIEYFGLSLLNLSTGESRPIPVPGNAVIGYPEWAPDGSRFAFTLVRPGRQMEIWIGLPDEARAYPLLTGVNGLRGAPCTFLARGNDLLCKRMTRHRPEPDSANLNMIAAGQNAGPQPLAAGQVRYLLESRLEQVDSETGATRPIGPVAAIDSVTPAPAAGYLLVERIDEPYPRYSGNEPVQSVREVWDRFGNVVARVPADARSVGWNASRPAELVWARQIDESDRIEALAAPFQDRPIDRFTLHDRFAGLRWVGDRNAALVSEHDPATRNTRLWYVPMTNPDRARVLTSYSSANTRIPIMRLNGHGLTAVAVDSGHIVLRGHEPVADRRLVVLERVSLADGATERLWEATDDGREELVAALGARGQYLLLRREDPTTPPHYVLTRLDGRASWTITREGHPAPALADVKRRRLEYARDDGTELSASLYLPPGHETGERLPLIVWAYPQRVLAGSDARLPDTTDQYPTFDRAFRHYFLLRGYAILDDVSMPVVGSAGSANDTFIHQIVADAEAAVGAALATGRIDPHRLGVAGHSYGAFMVANLLAHSRLFGAGVALSGAYNRTLTPFGFQTERRTLWDAPDTYIAMSPLIFADQIDAPLLLVHGLLDDNAGTAPIQSTLLFQAIRGNGGTADLLLLPWEGHAYRGRESVMKTAAGMLQWFDVHLPPRISEAHLQDQEHPKDTGALLRP